MNAKIIIFLLLILSVGCTQPIEEKEIIIPPTGEGEICRRPCHLSLYRVYTCWWETPDPKYGSIGCTHNLYPGDNCDDFLVCGDNCETIIKPGYKKCMDCIKECNLSEDWQCYEKCKK